MYNFLSALVKLKERNEKIALVILVLKYSSVLTPEYKTNIEFYNKMLPNLFSSGNVILVVTKVKQTEEWRTEEGASFNENIRILVNEIQSLLKIRYTVNYLCINSKCLAGSLDETHALGVRKTIFKRVVTSSEISLELKFPKTRKWLEEDNVLLVQKTCEKQVLMNELEKCLVNKGTLYKLEKKTEERENLRKKVKELEDKLAELDSMDSEVMTIHKLSATGKIFGPTVAPFKEITPYRIIEYESNWGSIEIIKREDKCIEGTVTFEHGFFESWDRHSCELRLTTHKYLKYEVEIKNFKEEIEKNKSKIERIDEEIEVLIRDNENKLLLENKLIIIEKQIVSLSMPTISFEESFQRIHKA